MVKEKGGNTRAQELVKKGKGGEPQQEEKGIFLWGSRRPAIKKKESQVRRKEKKPQKPKRIKRKEASITKNPPHGSQALSKKERVI